MRIVLFAAAALLMSFTFGQSLSPRLASIVPPDATFVPSINLERYADSALRSFYPTTQESSGLCFGKVRQIITAERAPAAGGGRLVILRRANVASVCASPEPTSDIAPASASNLTVLEAGTAITGDPDTVQLALDRWRQRGSEVDGDLGERIRTMSESYDNWLIARSPLRAMAEGQQSGPYQSYRSQFTEMVEEVRAGVRLGKINEVEVDLEMQTSEDAMTAAALGRWLRGLVQTRGGTEAALAEVAEGWSVTTTGKVVSLCFTLDSTKLLEIDEKRRAMEKAAVKDDGVSAIAIHFAENCASVTPPALDGPTCWTHSYRGQASSPRQSKTSSAAF